MAGVIKDITIKGFKSLRNIEGFELNNGLNILIGANGSGKSNFIQVFEMLIEMKQRSLVKYILTNGGSANFLHNGPKETEGIHLQFDFTLSEGGVNSYKATLIPTADEAFLLDESSSVDGRSWESYGPLARESRIRDEAISSMAVYHFHDTSLLAGMRRFEIIEDSKSLRPDAKNIAPFLLNLRENHPHNYKEIIDSIHLVMPFFDDFLLTVNSGGRVRLDWTQATSDFPMTPYQLSDGSIRFICLATALLQPNPPSIILIDEPELGLQPEAIAILVELINAVAISSQLIIATQSPLLLNYFSSEDVIFMKRGSMKRLNSNMLEAWLDDYSLGELWTKGVLEQAIE